ncbi:MAG: DUF1289 domain-containing protein [Haliscomenobacter sp.]|nr:DUF1289 domain-containing protein [Haliscomenobacter sp.]
MAKFFKIHQFAFIPLVSLRSPCTTNLQSGYCVGCGRTSRSFL